jgi:hypothetical protein
MRALLLRRTAFVAILATGFGLTAAGISGLSGMDTSLKLAAATSETRFQPVSERWGECDREREPWAPPRHRV